MDKEEGEPDVPKSPQIQKKRKKSLDKSNSHVKKNGGKLQKNGGKLRKNGVKLQKNGVKLHLNGEGSENASAAEKQNENNASEPAVNNEEDRQQSTSDDYRNKIVRKIADAIHTKDENGTKLNKAVGDHEAYAEVIEENMFQLALCKSQYCHFIYEKLEKIKNGSLDEVLKEAEGSILPKDASTEKTESVPNGKIQVNKNINLERLRSIGNKPGTKFWMAWLVHSQKCQQDNQANDPNFCNTIHCKEVTNFLKHIKTCSAGRRCPFPKCQHLQIMCFCHWLSCSRNDCTCCQIISEFSNKVSTNIAGSTVANATVANVEPMPSTSGGRQTNQVVNGDPTPSTSTVRQTNQVVNGNPRPSASEMIRGLQTSYMEKCMSTYRNRCQFPDFLHNSNGQKQNRTETQTTNQNTNYTRPFTRSVNYPPNITSNTPSASVSVPYLLSPRPSRAFSKFSSAPPLASNYYQLKLSTWSPTKTDNGTLAPLNNSSNNNPSPSNTVTVPPNIQPLSTIRRPTNSDVQPNSEPQPSNITSEDDEIEYIDLNDTQ